MERGRVGRCAPPEGANHPSARWSRVDADNVGSPSGPGTEERVFRYILHSPDGDDLGEATYAVMIKPGEEILVGNGRRFRVLDVVPFEEEDESPFVGLATGRGGITAGAASRMLSRLPVAAPARDDVMPLACGSGVAKVASVGVRGLQPH